MHNTTYHIFEARCVADPRLSRTLHAVMVAIAGIPAGSDGGDQLLQSGHLQTIVLAVVLDQLLGKEQLAGRCGQSQQREKNDERQHTCHHVNAPSQVSRPVFALRFYSTSVGYWPCTAPGARWYRSAYQGKAEYKARTSRTCLHITVVFILRFRVTGWRP